MQFKPESIVAIRDGRKTQTRRPVSLLDSIGHRGTEVFWVKRGGRWQVGKTYSMCPGRGKPRVGLIRLVSIRREPVLAISNEDASAEGFADSNTFLKAWQRLYPRSNLDDLVWVLGFQLT